MTTKVIVSVPEGQPHAVQVRSTSGPMVTEIQPGGSAEFHVWQGQTLHIEETK